LLTHKLETDTTPANPTKTNAEEEVSIPQLNLQHYCDLRNPTCDAESEYHSFSEDSQPEDKLFHDALEYFEGEFQTLDSLTTVSEEEQRDSTQPISSQASLAADVESSFDRTTEEQEDETDGITSLHSPYIYSLDRPSFGIPRSTCDTPFATSPDPSSPISIVTDTTTEDPGLPVGEYMATHMLGNSLALPPTNLCVASQQGRYTEVDYSVYVTTVRENTTAAHDFGLMKDLLIEALSAFPSDYLITIANMHIPLENGNEFSFPVVHISLSDQRYLHSASDKLRDMWNGENELFSDYMLCVSEGTFTPYMEEPRVYRRYHPDVQLNVSLGWRNFAATCGPIFKSTDGRLYGLTVAHLFQGKEKNPINEPVSQPAYLDFVDHATYAKTTLNRMTDVLQRVTKAGDTVNQSALEDDIKSHSKKHNEVISKEYGDSNEYSSSNVLGKVVDAQYDIVDRNDRICELDYALFEITSRNLPLVHFEHTPPRPHRGVLSQCDWTKAALKGVGELKVDSVVWKQGRETGITYGMVAGTHALYCQAGKLREEFWVLQDAWATVLYAFAEHGDSGSLVTTINGDAVGIILGGWTSINQNIEMVVKNSGHLEWDLLQIPHLRKADGTLDLTGKLTFGVTRPLTIVMDLQMIISSLSVEGLDLWVPG
jgi:hypothetical protein